MGGDDNTLEVVVVASAAVVGMVVASMVVGAPIAITMNVGGVLSFTVRTFVFRK